jgi:polysaccharide transporter, PST family
LTSLQGSQIADIPRAMPNLGHRAARGALVMIIGQIGRLAIQLGGVLIMARVLAPQDYGAYAMVTALVSFGELLQDFGLSSAAIQAREVSHAQQSNLFWINASIGLTLTAAVFFGAPLIGMFYHQPALVPITQALAPTFAINGAACQFRAHLTRNFQMAALSIAVVAAQAAGLTAGLTAALHGLGTWSLVLQQLTFNVIQLGLLVRAAQFWPTLPSRNVGTRSFLRFGSSLMATQLLGQLSRNLNTMLIGNRFGAELAGLYDRAFMLLMLPLNQIQVPANTVALPTLSKLQSDSLRFERYLLHGQTLLLHTLLAVFAYAAAVGDVLISVVMGPQWQAAAPLFRILTVAGAFHAAGYATSWAFTAKGLSAEIFRFSLVTRIALVVLMCGGIAWGVRGATVAYALGTAVIWPIGLIWLKRTSDAPAWAMAQSGARCLVAYSICGLVAWRAACAVAKYSPYAQLAAAVLGMLCAGALLALVWPRYRSDLHAITKTRALLRGASGG